MPMEKFSDAYKYTKGWLGQTYTGPLKSVMASLSDSMTDKGFDVLCGPRLELLRGLLKIREDERILQSVGLDPGSNAAPQTAPTKTMMAAAIKFLRHTYLIHERGGQKVWVHSLPKSWKNYTHKEIWNVSSNMAEVRSKLKDKDEQFSKEQKKHLGVATQTGLAWVQKTLSALGKASADDSSDEFKMVRRWFARNSTSDERVKRYITKLQAGFRKIVKTINSNQIVYLDMPTIRGATAGEDKKFFEAYAFVYSGRHEVIPIIYIEKAFFSNNTTPIPAAALWALTVVHELTHLEYSTVDHKYDFHGLRPRSGFNSGKAIQNADSWAYYCAEAAGGITKAQADKALKGFNNA